VYVIMLLGCGLVGTDRTQGDHQFRLGLSGNSQRARQGQTQLAQHSPGKNIAQEIFAQENAPNSAPTTWFFEKNPATNSSAQALQLKLFNSSLAAQVLRALYH
jgi:hypothetical protein